jgi:hypothetical protein
MVQKHYLPLPSWNHDVQHNNTQNNDGQHYYTQLNGTQHNETPHRN